MRPRSIRSIASHRTAPSAASFTAAMIVVPAACASISQPRKRLRASASSEANGSSSSKTRGAATSAAASASRLRKPVESVLTTASAASADRSRAASIVACAQRADWPRRDTRTSSRYPARAVAPLQEDRHPRTSHGGASRTENAQHRRHRSRPCPTSVAAAPRGRAATPSDPNHCGRGARHSPLPRHRGRSRPMPQSGRSEARADASAPAASLRILGSRR